MKSGLGGNLGDIKKQEIIFIRECADQTSLPNVLTSLLWSRGEDADRVANLLADIREHKKKNSFKR